MPRLFFAGLRATRGLSHAHPLRAPLLALALLLGAAAARAQALPPAVDAALARAKVPREAVTLMVVDVQGGQAPRLAHRTTAAVNPASVAKLVTSFAALELLGPAYAWNTPVYVDGPVQAGVLQGNLYIKGQGDPKLVVERLWLLMRRVQGLGIRTISGDIVLDHEAFETVAQDPGAFDGEPLKPYNAAPDALLLNYKAVMMTFVPERGGAPGPAQVLVHLEPPLAGVQMQAGVVPAAGECGDWRGALKADFADPARIRFAGSYPGACGEKTWPLAYVDPKSYSRRAVAGMWAELGGKLGGQARDGKVPAGLRPAFEIASPPLAEVIRDMNKYSNNVMAQQLFLTLSLKARGVGTLEGSREVLRAWWRERFGAEGAPELANGSGLSRDDRLTAQALARMLQAAWASPLMPELMSSLPITGVDGTLRRARGRIGGLAHLKTGSLRDVAGIAGYVDAASGRRYVVVAIANHANAAAARPAFEALVDWTASDQ